MYTYYQMALDRMLRKAFEKFRREIEISTVMKRACDANNLSKSMEQFEAFKGLKKQYKNSYSNVVNVSLETEVSIVEENQRPIQPAEPPYQRKRLKKYVEGPNGVLQGVMELQPYELDAETLKMIAKTVWRKLRQDAELTRQMQDELRHEAKLESARMAQGVEFDGLDGGEAEVRSERHFAKPRSGRRDSATVEAETKRPERTALSEVGRKKSKRKERDEGSTRRSKSRSRHKTKKEPDAESNNFDRRS